jgi:beta-fructofuranosidase
MVYGPTPIRYAVSSDMLNWKPKGRMKNAPDGRDPHILFLKNTYYLTVCGVNDVRIATSMDFQIWHQHKPILTMEKGIDPESPSLIHYNGTTELHGVSAYHSRLSI